MGFIKYELDESRFTNLFAQQTGFGMPKYRGSPMTGGSFWGRIVSFAKGLFSKAAPHINDVILRAQPHMKQMANRTIESAIDSAVDSVQRKLADAQAGKGIKGRKPPKRIPAPKYYVDRLPIKI